jgi:hypothetical protein
VHVCVTWSQENNSNPSGKKSCPRNCTSQQLPCSVWNGFFIRTCTPQLHPAIAPRNCTPQLHLAIAPRNCTPQLHIAIAPRNSYFASSGMDSTSVLAPRNCTPRLHLAIAPRNCTPQLHLAIATRKPRLERVLVCCPFSYQPHENIQKHEQGSLSESN